MDSIPHTNVWRRAFQIGRVCAVYFIFFRLSRHKHESLGARIRGVCEELGLVFIKLGQVLSTRYDLLDRSDCEELQKLLDEVPPLSYETVRKIFLTDFGKNPEELFAKFDPQHIASASIAQVYRAELADGTKLAVKVRRPGVDRAIGSDVRIFRAFAGIAEWFSRDIRHIGVSRVLDELQSWLLAEMDFKNEAKNLEKVDAYYHKMIKRPDAKFARMLVFPKPYPSLSSAHILVMSFIEGVSMRQFRSVTGNPEYDIKSSMEALMRAVLRAWINEEELYFHGDPHPSNLVLLPHGKIGLLDFGLLGRFDNKTITETRDLFLAVFSRNVEHSTKLALRLCNAPLRMDTPELREDIADYMEKSSFSGLGFWFIGFIRIFVKHRIPMPYQLILFGRCQTILDGVYETVLPGTRALDVLGEELEQGIRSRIVENIKSLNLTPILYALSEKMKKSPEAIAGLIDTYLDDPLEIVRDLRKAISGEPGR